MFAITKFSLATAFLICNLFFIIIICLSKSDKILLSMPLKIFAVIGFLLLFRLLFPAEFGNTKEITSYQIYPEILQFLEKTVFVFNGFELDIKSILIMVWVIVAVCILGIRLRFYRHLVKRFGHLQSICDERYLRILEEIKEMNHYQFDTTLIVDRNIETVMEYGYFKQIIFMPEGSYSDNELRYIFLHELEHFANKTNWIKLGVVILESILWWNPFVYPLRNSCSRLMEIHCDTQVSKKLTKKEKVAYLDCLLQEMKRESLITGNRQKFSFSSQFLWQSDLAQRFSVLLNYKRNRKIEIGIYGMILTLFFLSYGIVLQPAYRPPEENPSCIYDKDYYIEYENGEYLLYIEDEPFMSFRSVEEMELLGLSYGR